MQAAFAAAEARLAAGPGRAELSQIKKADIHELMAIHQPPRPLVQLLYALEVLLLKVQRRRARQAVCASQHSPDHAANHAAQTVCSTSAIVQQSQGIAAGEGLQVDQTQLDDAMQPACQEAHHHDAQAGQGLAAVPASPSSPQHGPAAMAAEPVSSAEYVPTCDEGSSQSGTSESTAYSTAGEPAHSADPQLKQAANAACARVAGPTATAQTDSPDTVNSQEEDTGAQDTDSEDSCRDASEAQGDDTGEEEVPELDSATWRAATWWRMLRITHELSFLADLQSALPLSKHTVRMLRARTGEGALCFDTASAWSQLACELSTRSPLTGAPRSYIHVQLRS